MSAEPEPDVAGAIDRLSVTVIRIADERNQYRQVLLAIQSILDGTEWQASLLDDIAQLLIINGFPVLDIEQ